MKPISLSLLAKRIGADHGDFPELTVTGVAGIKEATDGEVTFLTNRRYLPYLADCGATAVIVPAGREIASAGPLHLTVANPLTALINAVHYFYPEQRATGEGVHATAVISPEASLGDDVSIHAHVVVEAGAQVGDRTILMPGTFVGTGSTIGEDALIYPNVTIRDGVVIGDRVIVHAGSVIGSDGFGFAHHEGAHRKIPQVGHVQIEDDVEIGANTTVDRATLGTTIVGRGTKIDNLVQIGHNVSIGENTLLCAQVGISGSTEIGRNVVLAGQAGVTGHIRVGDGAVIAGQAGVTRPVPDGMCVSGYPARPHQEANRAIARVNSLPRVFDSLDRLERRIASLEAENRRLTAELLERV